jgi:hypothetical protein
MTDNSVTTGSGASHVRMEDQPAIDMNVPNRARIHDYLLGGDSSFDVDRSAADFVAMALPGVREGLQVNRAFLQRAVRFLARECAIGQFLDIGSGLPTQGNVHEIALSVNPGARVVYVDNDPAVVAHARILLSGSPDNIGYIQGDLRDPDAIVAHPDVRRTIDFGRPVAVVLTGVLQSLGDADEPYEKVDRLKAAVVPGSYLVLTHATQDPAASPETARAFGHSAAPTVTRQREGTLRFFDGLELVEPGLVMPVEWRPDGDAGQQQDSSAARPYGGVAVKR